MDLFAITTTEEIRLRVADALARSRLAAWRFAAAAGAARAPLRALQLALWGDPIEVGGPVPRRPRTVAPSVETIAGPLAASSVFALAASRPVLGHKLWRQPASERAPVRIERDGDSVRLIRMLPQETAEWQERERARRARQRPPRPAKHVRTRSQKLKDLVGDGDGED